MPGHAEFKDDARGEALGRLIDIGHLSSGVGHHVINAFSAIVSNAELLRLEPTTKVNVDPAALADTIIDTALKAATVARRLIDYSRPVTSIEPENAAFEPHTLVLDRLVAESAEVERARHPGHLNWSLDLLPVPALKGHPEQIRHLLAHLLNNAVESIGAREGTVSISTGTDPRGWVVLEVGDTGAGMSQAVLERAVEPFFSTKPGHMGVGLSIANGIWRRHRGALAILSRPGEGARVRLCVEPSRDGA